MFLSPDCLVCQQIIAAVGPFASAYNEVQVVVLTKSPAPAWENDLDKQRIQLVTDESMFRTFGAQGTPFAVMLDESNAVESRGTPNSIAQLEALVSVQQYLYRWHGQHSLPLSADVMGVADVH